MTNHVTVPEKPTFAKFPSWRDYQRDGVDFIVNTDKRFNVIDGSTGSGKSLIAMAAAGLLNGRTYYLVGSKDLQDQLLRDFPELLLLKGRNNFDCLMKDVTCDQCMYRYVKEPCPKKERCPYVVQKMEAKEAKFVGWNYAMFLTNQYFVKDFPRVELLICDEAHLLEGQLMRFIDIKFNYRFFRDLNLPFPENDNREHILTVLDRALEVIGKKHEKAEGIVGGKIRSGGAPDIEEIELCSKWDNQMKKLRFFKSVYTPINWVLDYSNDPEKRRSYISFKPVKVAAFSNYIFDWADKVVLMSATNPPSSILCDSLGISQNDVSRLVIPSTFKVENRPVVFVPIGKMNRQCWKDTIEEIVPFLDGYCKCHKEKILVHCTNYKIADIVTSASHLFGNYQVCYHENAGERSGALYNFKRADPPAILISPSMETGVDLAGDLCRVQFILKVPFLSIGDIQVKERMNIDYPWYISSTIARLVQSSGRIVRSKNDWGVTYILDVCFDDLFRRYRGFFPRWFSESVYRVPTPSDNANLTPEDWLAILNREKLEKM